MSETSSANKWDSISDLRDGLKEFMRATFEDQPPFQVQSDAIPSILQCKDVMICAPTGNGKTLAYALPMIQRCIDAGSESLFALVVVPTKELANQTFMVITDVLDYLKEVDTALSVALLTNGRKIPTGAHFMITTPDALEDALTQARQAKRDPFNGLEMLVVDEADGVFGQAGIDAVLSLLSTSLQAVLLSATMADESTSEFQKKLLRDDSIVIRVDNTDEQAISHVVVKAGDMTERWLGLYALICIRVIDGRVIVFTETAAHAYGVHLFLSSFGVKSVVLGPLLPSDSRSSIVASFNNGQHSVLVAVDDGTTTEGEFSASRGVDFKQVDSVINFDAPRSYDQYVHRAGRTARGRNAGQTVTFVETDFAPLSDVEAGLGTTVEVTSLDMSALHAFRYRVTSVVDRITPTAIKRVQAAELRAEILNSEKLVGFFQANPHDKAVLQHSATTALKQHRHLSRGRLPDYLLPDMRATKRSAKNLQIRGTRTKKQQDKVRKRRRVERKAKKSRGVKRM